MMNWSTFTAVLLLFAALSSTPVHASQTPCPAPNETPNSDWYQMVSLCYNVSSSYDQDITKTPCYQAQQIQNECIYGPLGDTQSEEDALTQQSCLCNTHVWADVNYWSFEEKYNRTLPPSA